MGGWDPEGRAVRGLRAVSWSGQGTGAVGAAGVVRVGDRDGQASSGDRVPENGTTDAVRDPGMTRGPPREKGSIAAEGRSKALSGKGASHRGTESSGWASPTGRIGRWVAPVHTRDDRSTIR